jgi:dTDP-4-dehydrorhamnose 3,5-epimerase
MMTVQPASLSGLYVIDPETAHDARGVVRGGFHPTQYAAFGLTGRFVSDRLMRGFQGSLRGLYIIPEGQSILITPVRGDMVLAVVDTRANSKTFGKIEMIDISESHSPQIYLSAGLAYGVCVRSENADWHEKFTGIYEQHAFQGLFWNDTDLSIKWPVKYPLVADEENRFPTLRQLFPVFA